MNTRNDRKLALLYIHFFLPEELVVECMVECVVECIVKQVV